MASGKGDRLATAVGFLSGLLACLDALRDARVTWPPDVAWTQMSHPHRLEFSAGLVLIVVTLAITLVRARTQTE